MVCIEIELSRKVKGGIEFYYCICLVVYRPKIGICPDGLFALPRIIVWQFFRLWLRGSVFG